MKRAFCGAMLGLLFLSTGFSVTERADSTDKAIASRFAEVNGVKLHYLDCRPRPNAHLAPRLRRNLADVEARLFPLLAERFTVIAPDLPGIGDSGIPAQGLDMKSAAISIHELAKSLGVQKAEVVGHDIGLMVAYAYAAQFPTEVTKLVLMDAFLPGVPGWEPIYNNPGIWHFRFNGPTPEALVQGRERIYFDYFWNDFAADKNHSIPEADRKAYVAAYSRPGRMHAGWEYFVSFPQAAKDFRSALPDESDDASPDHRWRKVVGSAAGRAGQAGGYQRQGRSAEERRALGARGAAQRDHRGVARVFVSFIAS